MVQTTLGFHVSHAGSWLQVDWLGISLNIYLCLLQVYWCKSGELPAEKQWFLYFVGICIVIESIFTNVLLYHRPLV